MSVQQEKSTSRARPAAVDAARPEPDPAEGESTQRLAKIAVAAYFSAERRGFEPGHEIEDWLAAEAEIDGIELPSVVTRMEMSTKGKAS
jgi:hypothetical protein